MSKIHDIMVAKLSTEDRARYDTAVVSGVCWNPGCNEPCFALFNSPAYQCSKHGAANLAKAFETPWEGDSLKEISDGEQLGALIRDRCGLQDL